MTEQYPIKLEDAVKFEEKFSDNKFPNQRWGQAFCNYFNITCPEIFYETNIKDAQIRAYLNLVDCS